MVWKCIVPTCDGAKKTDPNLILHILPKNTARCSEWLKALGLLDHAEYFEKLKNRPKVCSNHFSDSSYNIKKVLKEDAVPQVLANANFGIRKFSEERPTSVSCQTDHEIHPHPQAEIASQTEVYILNQDRETQTKSPPNNSDNDRSTQTPQSISENTPRKRKLKTEAKVAAKRLKFAENELAQKCIITKEDFIKYMETCFDSNLMEFIKCQLMLKQKCKNNRYTIEFKLFSLNIYYHSPQAYRFLASFFSLPSVRTLQRFNIPITTGLNTHFLNALKVKSNNMNALEKYSVICIDAMSLKTNLYYNISEDKIHGFHEVDNQPLPKPAKYAYVIMLRGMFKKWKQPIAYALISECQNEPRLLSWVDSVMQILIEIGFDVKALISDQGTDMVSASKCRNISINNTYFKIADKKIYYIFDVPHLLKSARNNLMKYDFKFNDKIAKWEDISFVYNFEKEKLLKLVPKLSEAHINPNNFQKMRVFLAAQIFSHTLAAAMNTYINFGQLNDSASGTVELVTKMNNLFDILNSNAIKNNYVYKRAYKGEIWQEEYLDEMLHFFQNLKLETKQKDDVTKRVNFISGFIISIKSIKDLWNDLKQENLKFLLTRNLNQDCLENFFGKIRMQGGNCQEPTCIQFNRAFRKIFVVNMIKNSSQQNCEDDLAETLFKIKDYAQVQDQSQISSEKTNENNMCLSVGVQDYKFDLPDINAIVYISGYLIRKSLERHNCCDFKTYLKAGGSVNYAPETLYTHYKSYNETNSKKTMSGHLIIPPESFVAFVKNMEIIFTSVFVKNQLPLNIGTSILESMTNINIYPCQCFPNDFVKKLFVRMRIYYCIMFNNKNFKCSKQNRKFIKINNL